MSKIQLRKQLFIAHTTDLLDVMSDLDANKVPNVNNRVLCPICLVAFPKEAIFDDTLTDGHVWPETIRQRSEKARHYRVLLCKKCNNSSGSRGDAQMQRFKQVLDEESSGHYANRRVEIAFGPDIPPVLLNASITTTNTGNSSPLNAKIRFEPSRNDPSELARFRILSHDRNFSLIIPPHNQIKPDVAKVGWLTAAYLMCFRAFGYRYILHPWLEPVRRCILDSFDNNKPVFPESDVLQVRSCEEHDYEDPSVDVIVTPNGSHPVFVQVDFWNLHIRLPFHFNPDILRLAIRLHMPDDFVLPKGEGETLGIKVECTKINPHECMWDYVIGKPEPGSESAGSINKQEGETMKRKMAQVRVWNKTQEEWRLVEVASDQVLAAFAWYDRQYPENDYKPRGRKTWLEDGRYKYAVQYKSKIYPPKYILRRVIGAARGFYGGGKAKDYTNAVLEELGFNIIPKPGI